MTNIINLIAEKKFNEADEELSSIIPLIMEKKIFEMKRAVAAKMCEQMGLGPTNSQKRHMDVIEAADPKEDSMSVERGTPQQPKNTTVVPKNNMGGPGSTHYKNMKEQVVNRDTKSSSPAYKSAQTRYINKTITGKNTDGAIASSLAKDDMTPQERMKSNETQQINTQLKTPAPKAGGYTDARTNKPYVAPKAEQMPLRGPTTQGSSQVNTAGKSDRVVRPSPTSTAGNTTTVKKVTYEETEEQLDEARINIVKARVRGGKVQRRKKVSNVPGMTLRGGQLKRMSAAERRRRKMGARKGKMKRKAKLTRSLMKRKRSLQRRKLLGL